jgi:hypothetical protein
MTNNKKMINLFIIIGLIGGVLIALSIAGYRIYSGKESAEKEQKAIDQRNEINKNISDSGDSIKKDVKETNFNIENKIDSTQKRSIDNQNHKFEQSEKKIENSTNKIITKISETSETQNKNQKEILSEIDELKNPPKDSNALYRNGEKKGSIKNFTKQGNNFTIDEIIYDKPMRGTDEIFSPFEYKNYIIKITDVNTLTLMLPPGATGIKGVILEEKK